MNPEPCYAVAPFDDTDTSADTEALVGDGSGSRFWDALNRELGIEPRKCSEILDLAREHGVGNRGGSMPAAQLKSGLIQILEYLFKHPSICDSYATLYVLDDPLLDDIVGHKCPSEFAKSIGMTKARVNKAVIQVQEHFKLPPRAGQRGSGGRAAMTAARMKQLTK